MDINLQQNPQPLSMARRALVLMQTRQLGVTRRLAEYIASHIENQTLTWIEQLLMNNLREFLLHDGQDEFRFSPQADLVVR